MQIRVYVPDIVDCTQLAPTGSLWTSVSFDMCKTSGDFLHPQPFILFSFSFSLYTSTHLAVVPAQFM